MMDESYEKSVAEYEAARNHALDKWFSARPSIERTPESERIFEGGFRIAWEVAEDRRKLIAKTIEDNQRIHDNVAEALEKAGKLEKALLPPNK